MHGLARTVPALALAMLTSGCVFTHDLWTKPEDAAPPPVVGTNVPCNVLDVRTVPPASEDDDAGMLLQFVPADPAHVPLHLRRFTPDDPGWLLLQPPADGDWRTMPGGARFRAESWDLRVTNATYFAQPYANARVRFFGSLPPEAIATVVAPDDLPKSLPAAPIPVSDALFDPTARVLRAFVGHDWAALLMPNAPPRRFQTEPIAWLGPDGEVLPQPPVAGILDDDGYRPPHPQLERCSLLGRLKDPYGNELWVRVPVPVLLQGDHLQLARDGDRIDWRRSQIWRAIFVSGPSDATAALDLPLRNRRFAYRWGEEVPPWHLPPALNEAKKIALTPLAVAADILVFGNPYLTNLYRWLTRPTWPPEQPERAPGR